MRQVGAHEAELAPEPQQPASSITKVGVSHIQLGSPIGSGTYGYVRNGMWHNRAVALKKFAEKVDYQSQLAAAHSMWRCVHPNINTLFGISVAQQQLLLILEYCSGGSLYDFLRSSREQIPQDTIVDSCLQILNGVDYLSSMGLNPLLSSANVMIMLVNGSQHVLKLTDYASTVAERLSLKSEVWSFGVITWELFTREIPYSVTDAALIRSVTAAIAHANLTPGIPSDMPLVLSEVCQSCWEADKIRPSFSDIRMQLKQAALTPMQEQPLLAEKRGSRVSAAARSLFSSDGKSPQPPSESKIPLPTDHLSSANGSSRSGGSEDLLGEFAGLLASRSSNAGGSSGGASAADDRSWSGSAGSGTPTSRHPGDRGGDGPAPNTPGWQISQGADPAIHLPTPQRKRRGDTIREQRSAQSLLPPPGYTGPGSATSRAAGAGAAVRKGGGKGSNGNSPSRTSKVWAWFQKLKKLRRASPSPSASRAKERAPTLSTRKAPGFTTRTTIIEKPPGGWKGGLGVQIEFDKEKKYLGAMVSSIKPGSAADLAGNIYVGDVIVGINGEMMIDAEPQTVLDAFNVQGEIIVVNLAPRSQVHKVLEQWFPDGTPEQQQQQQQQQHMQQQQQHMQQQQRTEHGGLFSGGKAMQGGWGGPRHAQAHSNADMGLKVHEHFFPTVEQEDHDLYEFMALESTLRAEEVESEAPGYAEENDLRIASAVSGSYDPLNSTSGSLVSDASSPGRQGGRRSRAPQEAYMTMENTVNDMREKLFLLDDQIMTQLETITRKERAQQNLALADLERVTMKEKSRPYMTNVIARAVHQHQSDTDGAPATPMHV
eukprot:gene4704-1923_t